MIEATAKGLPQQSHCFIQVGPYDISREVLERYGHADLQCMLTVADVHSVLSATLLQWLWRCEQLRAELMSSLANWRLIPAAAMARALIETAAAIDYDLEAFSRSWAEVKASHLASLNQQSRLQLQRALLQPFLGTRIKEWVAAKVPERTNVLSQIRAMAKRRNANALHHLYERLCDAVHPSWGSNEAFWYKQETAKDRLEHRWTIAREAPSRHAHPTHPGQAGTELPDAIAIGAAWSARTILDATGIGMHLLADLSLTGRLHLNGEYRHWGIVTPTGASEPCACLSGLLTSQCSHRFGLAAELRS